MVIVKCANLGAVGLINELAIVYEMGCLGYELASCKNELFCQKWLSEWISFEWMDKLRQVLDTYLDIVLDKSKIIFG